MGGPDAVAAGFVNMQVVKQHPGLAQALSHNMNPLEALMLAGITESLRQSNWLALGLHLEGDKLSLRAAVDGKLGSATGPAAFTLPTQPGEGALLAALDTRLSEDLAQEGLAREFIRRDTSFNVDGVTIGGKRIVIMAGPCSVESRSQLLESAQAVKEAGGHMLRGGAFKPRTGPHSFQGLGYEGLDYLAEAVHAAGHKADLLDLCWEPDPATAIERFFSRTTCRLVGVTLRNTDDCSFFSRQSFLPEVAHPFHPPARGPCLPLNWQR